MMRGATEVKYTVDSDASHPAMSRKFQHNEEFSILWQIINNEKLSNLWQDLKMS